MPSTSLLGNSWFSIFRVNSEPWCQFMDVYQDMKPTFCICDILYFKSTLLRGWLLFNSKWAIFQLMIRAKDLARANCDICLAQDQCDQFTFIAPAHKNTGKHVAPLEDVTQIKPVVDLTAKTRVLSSRRIRIIEFWVVLKSGSILRPITQGTLLVHYSTKSLASWRTI